MLAGMGFGLIVVAFAAIAAAIAFAGIYAKRKRQQTFARFAVLQGLQYAPEDPYGLIGLRFALFRRGDGRGIENVLWGTWHDTPLQAFDYWYYDESTDGKGNRSRTYHRFECAVSTVDAACPHLTLDHENLFTRLADHLAMHDIEFESEDFNHAYNVKCDDERFAFAFVDARMIVWLMAHGDGYAFEVVGDRLLVACRRLDPMALVPVLGTVRDFRAQVPRDVPSLYPKSG
jgi:hypothetical protein